MPAILSGQRAPREPEKDNPLDVIAKGLDIATRIYGLKVETDKLAQAKEMATQEMQLKRDLQESGRPKREFEQLESQVKSAELRGQGFSPATIFQKGYVPAKGTDKDSIELPTLGLNPQSGLLEALPQKYKKAANESELAQSIAALTIQQKQGDIAQQKRQQTLEGKYEKLGSEAKSKLGYAISVDTGLDAIAKALDSGIMPPRINANTPMIGQFVSDDPFTIAARQAAENYGRYQSGGAISKEEEEKFLQALPRAGDSPKIRAQKIQQLKNEMNTKARSQGFDFDQLKEIGIYKVEPEAPKFDPSKPFKVIE